VKKFLKEWAIIFLGMMIFLSILALIFLGFIILLIYTPWYVCASVVITAFALFLSFIIAVQ